MSGESPIANDTDHETSPCTIARDSRLARAFWSGDVETFAAESKLNDFYRLRVELTTLALSNLPPRARILDLGCGSGALAVRLAEAGYPVTGLDLSPAQIARARMAAAKSHREIAFQVGGLEVLDPAIQYDAACALGVLPYITDKRAFVRELADWVTQHGQIVITETRAASLYTVLALLAHLRRFTPARAWLDVANNLVRTGVWSGGFIDRTRAVPLAGRRATDAFLRSLGFIPTRSFALFNIPWLDRSASHG